MRAWEVAWATDKLQKGCSRGIGAAEPMPSMFLFLAAAAISNQHQKIVQATDVDDVLKLFIRQRLVLKPLLNTARRMRTRERNEHPS